MSNQIKYYSLNSLPTSAEIGAIYYLSNGSQFIGTSSNTFLPISDFIFTDTMPVLGIMNKIYVHKEVDKTSLKIWSGTGFELLGGEEFDDSVILQSISTLQNELNTNTLAINNLTSQLSPIPSQITSLDTRLNEIEAKKKYSTIVISTSDVSIGNKPSVIEVPYTSNIASVKAILSNDSGTQVDYSIEKSTDGLVWTSAVDGNVGVGSVISNTSSTVTLNENELLRLVVNSDNEDVNGLTINITIEEQ